VHTRSVVVNTVGLSSVQSSSPVYEPNIVHERSVQSTGQFHNVLCSRQSSWPLSNSYPSSRQPRNRECKHVPRLITRVSKQRGFDHEFCTFINKTET